MVLKVLNALLQVVCYLWQLFDSSNALHKYSVLIRRKMISHANLEWKITHFIDLKKIINVGSIG